MPVWGRAILHPSPCHRADAGGLYDRLFPVLRTQGEIEALINPFVSAYLNKAREQLEGQIASAKISLARLVSPQLYYVLSGNDFTLDINNPAAPKVVCIGNNPQKLQVYGAVLSLYVSRVVKLVNRKGQLKSSLVFDEFPTIYFNGIDSLIATARSNKVATTLGVQDFSQLKKDYGRDQAEVILNTVGNIISGQVTGDTAKLLSERMGKIMQERNSVSVNSSDTSFSKSTQLDFAVPAAKVSALSSGEFVGMVADNPDAKINLKAFHCQIMNDHAAIKREEERYRPLPVIREVTPEEIQAAYDTIREDIRQLVEEEIRLLQANLTPDSSNMSGGQPMDEAPFRYKPAGGREIELWEYGKPSAGFPTFPQHGGGGCCYFLVKTKKTFFTSRFLSLSSSEGEGHVFRREGSLPLGHGSAAPM